MLSKILAVFKKRVVPPLPQTQDERIRTLLINCNLLEVREDSRTVKTPQRSLP